MGLRLLQKDGIYITLRGIQNGIPEIRKAYGEAEKSVAGNSNSETTVEK